MRSKFISPLAVILPRKKKIDRKVYLNLNIFRNLHFQINNQAKVEYNEMMREQLQDVKLQTPIELKFVLYKKQNRKTDRSNILSICEKFFCDALVHWKCIPDDNDDFISSTHYFSNGIDKSNPRVEILITERP